MFKNYASAFAFGLLVLIPATDGHADDKFIWGSGRDRGIVITSGRNASNEIRLEADSNISVRDLIETRDAVSRLKDENESLKNSVKTLERSNQDLNSKIDAMERKVSSLESKLNSLK